MACRPARRSTAAPPAPGRWARKAWQIAPDVMPSLSETQRRLCGDGFAGDYRGFKAAFINCTLKKPPEVSHTAALMQVAEHIMRRHGVEVTHLRVVEHAVPPGI